MRPVATLVFAVLYIAGVVVAGLADIGPANSLWTALISVLVLLIVSLRSTARHKSPTQLNSATLCQGIDSPESPTAYECLASHASAVGRNMDFLRLLIATIVFFALGLFLTESREQSLQTGLLNNSAENSSHVTVEGFVLGDVKHKDGIAGFDIQVRKLRFSGVFDERVYGHKEWLLNEHLRISVQSKRKLELHMGEYIRVSGHLAIPKASGEFDYRRYLYHRGIMAVLRTAPEDLGIVQYSGSRLSPEYVVNSLRFAAGSLRGWIKWANSAYLPEDCAGLLNGIVLGDASSISKDIEESFRATGLTHVVAASGMNIALIVAALWPLLRLLRLRLGVQIAILIALAGAYTIVAGMAASITRAFIMAAIALIAWLLGREKVGLNSLSLAALILLIINPFALYDIGFQLSFASTASLIMLSGPLERAMGDMPKFLREGLGVTVAAQLGVLPIIVFYFGQISVISLVANIVVTPLAAPALIIGMVVLPALALSAKLAMPLYALLKVILKLMIVASFYLSKTPGAYLSVAQPSMYLTIAAYVVIAVLGIYLHKIRVKFRVIHVAMLLVVVTGASILWQINQSLVSPRLEIIFIDVGQGDCALIRTPTGENVLIDSGPDERLIKRKLETRGVKKIDALLISHAHADHMAGVEEIIDRFAVGRIMYPPTTRKAEICKGLFILAKKKGIKCTPVESGDKARLGKLELTALCSAASEEGNDESAVLMASYGRFKVLFTGDASEELESRLIEAGEELDADVLKVGHHGSGSSSSDDFLSKVSPEISVISVGKGNMYGHPSGEAIARLRSAGSKIYRTDKNGDVTIESDGESFSVYVKRQ